MVESKTQPGGVRGWKQRRDGQGWRSGVWGGSENMGQPGLLSALQTAGDRPEASAGPGGRRPLLSFAPCVRSKTNIPETEMGPAVPQTAELARWGQNWGRVQGGESVSLALSTREKPCRAISSVSLTHHHPPPAAPSTPTGSPSPCQFPDTLLLANSPGKDNSLLR